MSGRSWAYLGIAVGGLISVYGNIAEEYLHGHPATDSVVLAAAAPVVLFIMVELLTAVRGNGVAAWVVRLATLGVAAVAFWTSYQHLRGLLLARGESPSTGALYPLGIDGLLVGAAAVLWQIRTSGTVTESVTSEATVPATAPEPEPVAVEVTAPAEAATQAPAGAPARRAIPRRTPAPATKVATDDALLARIDEAVQAGDLGASDVTLSRLRTLLGVGSSRAERLAGTWHEQHRRTAVAAVAST